jgi:hypothetical protein
MILKLWTSSKVILCLNLVYFEKMIFNFEKYLNAKSDEFKNIFAEKERENEILKQEILTLKKNSDEFKQDRIKDLKIMEELELNNNLSKAKLQGMEKVLKSNENIEMLNPEKHYIIKTVAVSLIN